jgi:hypothetical protein
MLWYSKSQQTSLTLQEKGTNSTIGHFALLTLFEKEAKLSTIWLFLQKSVY